MCSIERLFEPAPTRICRWWPIDIDQHTAGVASPLGQTGRALPRKRLTDEHTEHSHAARLSRVRHRLPLRCARPLHLPGAAAAARPVSTSRPCSTSTTASPPLSRLPRSPEPSARRIRVAPAEPRPARAGRPADPAWARRPGAHLPRPRVGPDDPDGRLGHGHADRRLRPSRSASSRCSRATPSTASPATSPNPARSARWCSASSSSTRSPAARSPKARSSPSPAAERPPPTHCGKAGPGGGTRRDDDSFDPGRRHGGRSGVGPYAGPTPLECPGRTEPQARAAPSLSRNCAAV